MHRTTPHPHLPPVRHCPWIVTGFCTLPFVVAAQSDTLTTRPLPLVEVTARRSPDAFSTPFQSTPDSLSRRLRSFTTLAELLAAQSGMFLKTYGNGSLATAAFRGTGAGHTTVVWNGFNVKNPMNGVVDFALYPLALADRVEVQHGGGSSLYGSGAIGGTVILSDEIPVGEGLAATAAASVGSFSDFRQRAALRFSKKKIGSQLKWWSVQSQNNFPYGPDNKRLENAGLTHRGLTQHNRWDAGQLGRMETFAWWQAARRNIPPTRTEANSHATQNDDVLRLAARWSRRQASGITTLQSARLHEKILFFSDLLDSARSRSNTWTAALNHKLLLPHHSLLFAAQWERQNARTRETGPQQRRTLALSSAWKYPGHNERFFAEAHLRQAWVDGRSIPLTGSLGTSWAAMPAIRLTARLHRSYNLPTFNDLYWQDAFASGNPNLKPESALGAEAGFAFGKQTAPGNLQTTVRFFTSSISDWILWVPANGRWQPQNRRRVWARGFEWSAQHHHKTANWRWQQSLSIAFTRSTVAELYDSDPASQLGKQLIYTPLWKATLTAGASHSSLRLLFETSLTGSRHTTTDNDPAYQLSSFLLFNLHTGSDFTFLRQYFDLNLSLLNLLNHHYEVIAARPMPGRHFQLSLKWQMGK